MLDILERRLARETARHGGNEFTARIELIGFLQDRRKRMRGTDAFRTPIRQAVAEIMIYDLWEPIIPRMKEIGAEFGIEIDEAVMRPPR